MAKKSTSKGGKGKGKGGKGSGSKRPMVSRNSAIAAAVVAAGLAFVIGYVVGTGRGGSDGAPGEGDIAEREASKIYQVPLAKAPTKGPRDALITVVEWSDFECPHCARAAKTVDRLFERYEGKVRVAFKHNPLPSHRNAHKAAEASLAAHEQGRFWDYHDRLFAGQEQLAEKGTHYLLDIARDLDLDMDRFRSALEQGRFRKQVYADKALLRDLGQRGTPMFFVNGRLIRGAQPLNKFVEVFDLQERRAQQLLDDGTDRAGLYKALIAGGITPSADRRQPRDRASEPQPDVPVEVPRNPSGPGLGPADASVHIVEFFDFQCPACRTVPPELHKLHESFPEDVRIEFRQFPLPMHKAARALSEIALAAHEQGLYVETSDVLFANQGRFRGAGDKQGRTIGLELASEIEGMDAEKLRRDVESGSFGEKVDQDFAVGQETKLRGTPTIYINGKTARGRSYERLRNQVEGILAEGSAKRGGGAEDDHAGHDHAPGAHGKAPGKAPAKRPAKAPARAKAPGPAKAPVAAPEPTKSGEGEAP